MNECCDILVNSWFFFGLFQKISKLNTKHYNLLQRGGGGGGGFRLYEIYIGFCPRTNFYNIMHIACLVHGHLISNIDFLLNTLNF